MLVWTLVVCYCNRWKCRLVGLFWCTGGDSVECSEGVCGFYELLGAIVADRWVEKLDNVCYNVNVKLE